MIDEYVSYGDIMTLINVPSLSQNIVDIKGLHRYSAKHVKY